MNNWRNVRPRERQYWAEVNNGGCGGKSYVCVTLKLRRGLKKLATKSCIGGNNFLSGMTF